MPDSSHIGDLGNIETDENGEALVDIELHTVTRPSLFEGDTYILNRSIVIHAGEDDLTSEGDGVGNAGARLACGIIIDAGPEYITFENLMNLWTQEMIATHYSAAASVYTNDAILNVDGTSYE